MVSRGDLGVWDCATVYKKNEMGDLPAFCACNNDTPQKEAIQEALFEAYPKAFGETDEAKLHLQVPALPHHYRGRIPQCSVTL